MASSSAYTQRLERHLEHLYLMSTTFSALPLYERAAIGDTLLSLVCTFLERSAGACFLCEGEALSPIAIQGDLEAPFLASGHELWRTLADERVAQLVSTSRLPRSLLGASALAGGLAAVAVTVQDRVAALLVLGMSEGEAPLIDADLWFLTAAAGIGALSFASADAVRSQQQLTRDVERVASKARHEADERAHLVTELDGKLRIIDHQHQEILALSTPILEVWKGVLLLPIIGSLDERRGADMLSRLLAAVVTKRATDVIVDLTGAEVVDAKAAEQILKLIASLRLLGARGVITGIRATAARAMAGVSGELASTTTLLNLEQGLKLCMQSGGTQQIRKR